MARKRHSDEDIVKLLREIEVRLASGSDVSTACRAAGISDATYYTWRKKFGGMARSQLSEMKALEKENQGLKKIVADLCGRINLNAQVIAPSGALFARGGTNRRTTKRQRWNTWNSPESRADVRGGYAFDQTSPRAIRLFWW